MVLRELKVLIGGELAEHRVEVAADVGILVPEGVDEVVAVEQGIPGESLASAAEFALIVCEDGEVGQHLAALVDELRKIFVLGLALVVAVDGVVGLEVGLVEVAVEIVIVVGFVLHDRIVDVGAGNGEPADDVVVFGGRGRYLVGAALVFGVEIACVVGYGLILVGSCVAAAESLEVLIGGRFRKSSDGFGNSADAERKHSRQRKADRFFHDFILSHDELPSKYSYFYRAYFCAHYIPVNYNTIGNKRKQFARKISKYFILLLLALINFNYLTIIPYTRI